MKIDKKHFYFESAVELTQDSKTKTRTFAGIGYSGQPIKNHSYWGKVIFDLSSMTAKDNLPILLGHDRDKIVGSTTSVSIGYKFTLSGNISNATKHGKQVAKLADEGFPWQMSVHINPDDIEEIPLDKSITVNGQDFSGGTVFRNSTIKEVSFTPTGWDDNTSATVFSNSGDNNMDKNKERIEELEAENKTLKASNEKLNTKLSALEQSLQISEIGVFDDTLGFYGDDDWVVRSILKDIE